jgi:hypothetical protein
MRSLPIAEVELSFRNKEKPTLAEVARIANCASGLLRLNGDDKTTVENTAAIQIVRQRFNEMALRITRH